MSENGDSKIIARIEDVSLAFGENVVLKNCSLDIVEGAITCIIGLSGAGKSTILRLLDGLMLPERGARLHPRPRHLPPFRGATQSRPAEDQSFFSVFSSARQSHGRRKRCAPAARTHDDVGSRDPTHGHGSPRQRRAFSTRTNNLPSGAFRGHAEASRFRARDRYAPRAGPLRRTDDRPRSDRHQFDYRHDRETSPQAQWNRGRDFARPCRRSSRWRITSRCSSKARSLLTTRPSASATRRIPSSFNFFRGRRSGRSRFKGVTPPARLFLPK